MRLSERKASRPEDCEICDGTPAMHAQHVKDGATGGRCGYMRQRGAAPCVLPPRHAMPHQTAPLPVAECLEECFTCEPGGLLMDEPDRIAQCYAGHDVRPVEVKP